MLAGIVLLAGSAVPGAAQTSSGGLLGGLTQSGGGLLGGTLGLVGGLVKDVLSILGKVAPDLLTTASQHPNETQHLLVAGTPTSELQQMVRNAGGTIDGQFSTLGTMVIRLPGRSVLDLPS